MRPLSQACRSFRGSLLFVGIGLLVSQSCGAQQKQTPGQLYQDAVTADEHGQTENAIALYWQVVAADPRNLQAHTNLGVDLAHKGDYSAAIAEYRAALKIDPANPTVRLNLAIAEYKQANFEVAARELSALHKEHPENKQVTTLLADCDLRLGLNAETVALLEPVYHAAPSDEAVQYALGTALIREGKTQPGERVINNLLKNGNSAVANLLMGEAQFSSGDYKTAATTLQKAVAAEPTLSAAWSLYGRALLQSNNNVEAESALRHALQLDANDFDANLHLGALLRYNGNNAEAAPYLEKALRLRPRSPQAQLQVGALRASEDKLPQARQILENLEKGWPDFLEVHLQLATLYARLGLNEDSQRERGIVSKLNDQARKKGPAKE
jgi:Flp pilus assembly protein TadD